MAKISVKMPEEFLLKISKLNEKTDEIVPKILEAGGRVMLEKIKSNLLSVIGKETKHKSRSTGELVESLGLSPVLLDRKGNHDIKVGFSEPRRSGDSNAKIANIIEYGKKGRSAMPFLKPAITAGKRKCIEAMKAKLDEELTKI